MIGSRFAWLGLLALSTSSRRSVVAFSPSVSSLVGRASFHSSFRLFSSNDKAPRHDVRSDVNMEEIDPEEAAIQAAFAEHQEKAPKLSFAEDVRTLVQYNHGFAVMSTNSKSYVQCN